MANLGWRLDITASGAKQIKIWQEKANGNWGWLKTISADHGWVRTKRSLPNNPARLWIKVKWYDNVGGGETDYETVVGSDQSRNYSNPTTAALIDAFEDTTLPEGAAHPITGAFVTGITGTRTPDAGPFISSITGTPAGGGIDEERARRQALREKWDALGLDTVEKRRDFLRAGGSFDDVDVTLADASSDVVITEDDFDFPGSGLVEDIVDLFIPDAGAAEPGLPATTSSGGPARILVPVVAVVAGVGAALAGRSWYRRRRGFAAYGGGMANGWAEVP